MLAPWPRRFTQMQRATAEMSPITPDSRLLPSMPAALDVPRLQGRVGGRLEPVQPRCPRPRKFFAHLIRR